MSDPKDRLKQWGEDGYIDADLRNTFKDSLTRIEQLEAELSKFQESSFHPDWSMLEASQDSLREYMALCKELQARVAKLESAIVVYQAEEGHSSWTTDDAAIQAFLEDYEDVLVVTMRRQQVKGEDSK